MRKEPPFRAGKLRILFHPDYTVGPGVAPDLLTLCCQRRSRAIPPVGNCTPPWEYREHPRLGCLSGMGQRQQGLRRWPPRYPAL